MRSVMISTTGDVEFLLRMNQWETEILITFDFYIHMYVVGGEFVESSLGRYHFLW